MLADTVDRADATSQTIYFVTPQIVAAPAASPKLTFQMESHTILPWASRRFCSHRSSAPSGPGVVDRLGRLLLGPAEPFGLVGVLLALPQNPPAHLLQSILLARLPLRRSRRRQIAVGIGRGSGTSPNNTV